MAAAALVRLTGDVAVSTGTQTTVDWDAVVHDNFGWWSAGNPSRLTVPSGVSAVVVTAYLAFENNSTGDRWITIRKNGTDVVAEMMIPESPVVDNDRVYAQSPLLKVSPGDYFDVTAWQGSGGDLDLLNANSTFFSIEGFET